MRGCKIAAARDERPVSCLAKGPAACLVSDVNYYLIVIEVLKLSIFRLFLDICRSNDNFPPGKPYLMNAVTLAQLKSSINKYIFYLLDSDKYSCIL
jgi:hypothetical protein